MKMPAGTYWLGDPCYSLDSEHDWMEYCRSSQDEDVFVFKGHHCCALWTKWGDGTYEDQYGFEYGVDSATIGLTPIALAKAGQPFESKLVTFEQDFEVSNVCGILTFGHIVIDTANYSYDEDEE